MVITNAGLEMGRSYRSPLCKLYPPYLMDRAIGEPSVLWWPRDRWIAPQDVRQGEVRQRHHYLILDRMPYHTTMIDVQERYGLSDLELIVVMFDFVIRDGWSVQRMVRRNPTMADLCAVTGYDAIEMLWLRLRWQSRKRWWWRHHVLTGDGAVEAAFEKIRKHPGDRRYHHVPDPIWPGRTADGRRTRAKEHLEPCSQCGRVPAARLRGGMWTVGCHGECRPSCTAPDRLMAAQMFRSEDKFAPVWCDFRPGHCAVGQE